MLKKVRFLLNKYISLGADENTSDNDLKKIKLLHIFSNTWHLFTLLSFIEDSSKNQLVTYSYLLMFSLVLCVQILLYFQKIKLAGVLFVFNLFMVTLFFSNYIYVSELLEYYFLLPPAIALIYIDNKKINIFILVICLLGLFLPNLYFKHYPVSVLNNINPPFLFFSLFIVVSYFKNLNIKNEQKLEAKTKELEQLDKFKSQFFTNISHEIRTPLTLINGQISDLEKFATNNPNITNIQTGIKNQISTITSMVDNVLDLAKMQSSNFSLQLKPSNISDIVYKQYLNFEPLFKQKNIVFTISKKTKIFICEIDIVFFERAINNIIINALKYTHKGEVSINTYQKNQHVFITISDTGIGILKNDLALVFNRFYQVNNDINKAGGSGVGLAFSKEIIELHGGNLLLESKVNKGSTFTIKLPLEKNVLPIADKSNVNDTTPIKEVLEKRKPKVETGYTFLIVDDNYDMRQYLISILKNYSCIDVANGLDALEVIQEEKVNFIITDYMMPVLNGHEFVTKLKENNSTIPVIMLTAKTDLNTKLNVLKLGIDDYITKPFNKEELLTRIDNCINNYTSRSLYNKEHNIELKEFNNDFINDLKAFIYTNADNNILNQEMLAEKFNLSKSSFYRKIKSTTGLNPNSFIKEIKLQKAHEILQKNPTISLKELSLGVGFSHTNYFSKIYEKRFGIKPTKIINA